MIKRKIEKKIKEFNDDIIKTENELKSINRDKNEFIFNSKNENLQSYKRNLEKLKNLKLSFPKDFDTKTNEKLLKIISKDFDNLIFNYVFLGKAGCGKSYIASFLLNLIKSKFYQFDDDFCFMSIESEYKKYLISVNDKSKELYIPDVSKIFMIIDDVGIEKPATDASHQFVAGILEARYNYFMKNKNSSTIITTNLGSKEIINFYGDRVLDRWFDQFDIFEFSNDSYRKKNKSVIKL